MSMIMKMEIKRWTAKRKSALVQDIIQGKTTVSEASRTYDLSPSEVENWVDDARRGMENALRANPLYRATNLPDQRLAGQKTGHWLQAPHSGLTLSGQHTQ